MMVVVFIAIMLGRPAIAMRNVTVAAFLMLAAFPESLLDVGFQISFAAVTALVAAYEAVRGRMDSAGIAPGPVRRADLILGGILFSILIAGLAVTPLSLYHFHAMQRYAPLANLIAVPVCNIVVMPAALATLIALPFGLEAGLLWLLGQGIDAMGTVARYVAALPGAVTQIAAIPAIAFAIVLAGGLWLVLWQRRWRLAGLPLIVAGIALTPFNAKPEILIGRDGALLAVRDPQGRLAVRAERPSTFELKRWLEHDGDGRAPKDARQTAVFRCDPHGCTSQIKETVIALSRHTAGLADDCARATILITTGPRPALCSGPILIYDRDNLRQTGPVALRRDGAGGFVQDSVANRRGLRPWSTPPPPRRPRTPIESGPKSDPLRSLERPLAATTSVGRFAAPRTVADAFEADRELRPEIEDAGP